MTNIIYCFSGTGNSLWLAQNAAKEIGDTEVVNAPGDSHLVFTLD